jgi:hypothetical protein
MKRGKECGEGEKRECGGPQRGRKSEEGSMRKRE